MQILNEVAGIFDFAKRLIPRTADPVDMLAEGEEELLSVDCPHLDRLVIGRCDQILTVRGKIHTTHGGRVCLENG